MLTIEVSKAWPRLPLRPFRWMRANFTFFIAAFCCLAPQLARAQGDGVTSEDAVSVTHPVPPPKEPVESEIIYQGFDSYGNYKIFAAGWDMKMVKVGIEYDRHSWGYFLGARMDYVGEIIPFLYLNQAGKVSIWGNPFRGSGRKWVYGGGIAPIGLRMLWRDRKAVKPFLLAKGGVIAFSEKTPCNQCTYENFSLETETGLQVRMTPKVDLRLGMFGDFHFSNAFITDPNPGLDVMNASVGLSYHLGQPAAH